MYKFVNEFVANYVANYIAIAKSDSHFRIQLAGYVFFVLMMFVGCEITRLRVDGNETFSADVYDANGHYICKIDNDVLIKCKLINSALQRSTDNIMVWAIANQ